MKVIKNKYTIQFDSCENLMSTEIEISKDEYLKQLKYLEKLVDETEEHENPVSMDFRVYDRKQYTEKVYYFQCVTGTTILVHKIIKDGYRFLNKNEQK